MEISTSLLREKKALNCVLGYIKVGAEAIKRRLLECPMIVSLRYTLIAGQILSSTHPTGPILPPAQDSAGHSSSEVKNSTLQWVCQKRSSTMSVVLIFTLRLQHSDQILRVWIQRTMRSLLCQIQYYMLEVSFLRIYCQYSDTTKLHLNCLFQISPLIAF